MDEEEDENEGARVPLLSWPFFLWAKFLRTTAEKYKSVGLDYFPCSNPLTKIKTKDKDPFY